jgi:tetratricopeptide (TPR) repeat protein
MNHIQYAIARIGSNTNARLNYATLLGLRGEYRDALAQVNIVLKAAPRNWEARMTRLRIVAQLVNETTEEVDFNTLLDDLRFFVTTDSSNMNWRAQLASAYNNLEKYDSALVEIQVVIAHDSSNVFAHTIRGLAYYGLDSLLQARADLQWHIAESEMPAFNYFYLAAVAAKLRDDVSGLKDLKMAMKYGVRDVISKDEMLRNFKTLPPGRYVLYKRVIDSDV